MTRSTATYCVGDLEPPLAGTLDVAGVPFNGTGKQATVRLRRPDGSVISRDITVDATGAWSMPWEDDDLTLSGWWQAEVKVSMSSGRLETFPADSPIAFFVRLQIPDPAG